MNQGPDNGNRSRAVPLICLLAGLLLWFISYGVNDFGVVAGMCLALGGGLFLIAPRSWLS